MKRYVVTGGAGFIGSCLVRELLALPGGSEVAVVDNLLTGHRKNLDEVKDRITFHEVDICDFAGVKAALADADTVFHLAAIPSVPRSIHEPVPSHEVNINGTFNVLQAAHENKVRRVVYAASSSAYGDTDVLPKIETMQPKPKSPPPPPPPPICGPEADGRVLLQRVYILLWAGNRGAAVLQCVWAKAGSE